MLWDQAGQSRLERCPARQRGETTLEQRRFFLAPLLEARAFGPKSLHFPQLFGHEREGPVGHVSLDRPHLAVTWSTAIEACGSSIEHQGDESSEAVVRKRVRVG